MNQNEVAQQNEEKMLHEMFGAAKATKKNNDDYFEIIIIMQETGLCWSNINWAVDTKSYGNEVRGSIPVVPFGQPRSIFVSFFGEVSSV